jgi:hypothetical protein
MRRGHTGVFETGPAAAPFRFFGVCVLGNERPRVVAAARARDLYGFGDELRVRACATPPQEKELVGEGLS